MIQNHPQGFLAMPPSGKGRGILVLHPWWGLNSTMRTFCAHLSQAGFITFAVDLYHGKLATTIKDAESLSNALDGKKARADIAEAVDFLSERASFSNQKLAVIGFSLGAFFALDLSVSDPHRIGTVVVFYGTRPGDYSTSRADYLGHFAETDQYESESDVKGLEESLLAAGRPVSFHSYPGTGHWFFESDRKEAYNHAAATLAWERTLTFLRNSIPINSH